MPRPMPREIPIPTVGAKVHDVNFSEAVDLIIEWAREGSGGYVSTPNVDHLVRAKRDPKFKALMMGARLRVPDGMGLIYGSRLAGTPFRGAVTGRLLPEAIVRATADDPIPMAIIGGRDDAPQKAKARLEELGGKVVAAVGPPMGYVVGGPEDDKIVAAVRGCPAAHRARRFRRTQARDVDGAHQAELPEAVMLGIGQTIDILGGLIPAAPSWMTKVGLEWAFRMLRDPRRIGRRVFVDDPPFFWWMLKARLRR